MLTPDLSVLTGNKEIPAVETITVDLALLQRSPPADALKYLAAMRFLGIGAQFARFHEHPDGPRLLSPLVGRMFSPINPLLLITAVSLSVLRGEDVDSFLLHYARGLEVPGLETLLRIDDTGDESDLRNLLDREDEYLRALIELGVEILVQHGRLIESSGTPTMLDLYWACWLVANPMFGQDTLPTRSAERPSLLNGWYRGIHWGIEHNSAIHNAREYYEYRLEEANREINSLLARGTRDEEGRRALATAAERQRIVTRLVERARRFYYWAPHEIDAYSGQTRFATELMERLSGDPAHREDLEKLRKEHARFYLPPEIADRLRVQQEGGFDGADLSTAG